MEQESENHPPEQYYVQRCLYCKAYGRGRGATVSLLIYKLWIFFRNLMYVNLILRTLMRESCMHERDHTVHIQRL